MTNKEFEEWLAELKPVHYIKPKYIEITYPDEYLEALIYNAALHEDFK